MAKMIDPALSVDENYVAILKRHREIENRELSGEVLCAHCLRKKKEHLPDTRCSVYACSRNYRSVLVDEVAAIQAALKLIESLNEVAY